MAINKKLIHFKKYSDFIGNSGINGVTSPTDGYYHNIPSTSIVFIQDTRQIWTHGKLYDGSTVDLSNIEASILDILNNKLDNISDLETIRTGAALGATSVQPDAIANMETKNNSSYLYQLKGDYATKTELNNSLNLSKTYTDSAIANLVRSSSDNVDAINLLSTALLNNSDIVSLLNNSVSNKADKSLIFNNIQALTWKVIEDITFPYNYRCDIILENVTINDYAEITFNMINAISGDYAPICETYDGGVTIYSKIADIITIPTIIIYKNN